MNRTSGRHVQRRALAAMPGTVDGFMTSLCISLMTTQTANLQQKVLGCTRGRSARGRELPWRAVAPGFKRMPQQGADSVARIARYGQADFGRIEIQAPEASNQTVKQHTGSHVANRLQHYRPASFPAGASSPALSYLSGHSYPASRRAIRSQLRCDPDSRSDVHTLLFHRFSYSVRPMDTPPCRMLFLFSHMLWVMPIAKQLYIQNEGLSDIFCRNAEFLIVQVLAGLSTAYRANRFRRRASSVLLGWPDTSCTTASFLDCRALACFTRCAIVGMTCCMY